MGKIAYENADKVIVTDDNPRYENPSDIRKEVLAACPDGIEFGDRSEAVRFALKNAKKGDAILIAGKGHEEYQEINGEKIPCSDFQSILDA